MQIQKATAADLAAIRALDGHAIHNDLIAASVEAGQCFVCCLEGRIVGHAILNISFYGCGFLALLAVHPQYRRRGIATALIRQAESVCPTAKFFTSTNQSNLPAQRLFESLGFVRSGWIDNLDEGGPEVVYFKRLR